MSGAVVAATGEDGCDFCAGRGGDAAGGDFDPVGTAEWRGAGVEGRAGDEGHVEDVFEGWGRGGGHCVCVLGVVMLEGKCSRAEG